ncbi:MAG: Rrf2 family transcriptional regulator [Thermodesulfobacteriota bacterium]|nr:MAG: Rrf2 family transcriptional regulator [Thermodesulfobacteriota bacterium]
MLQLTRNGEYAVRAVLYLASQPPGKPALITEISESQEVPKSYLSKIMQHLVRAGLVRSRRGINGGFTLARPAESITLKETIEAVEGPIHLNICLIKKGECHRDDFCPVHPVWQEAQRRLSEVLDGKSMADLARDGEAIKNRLKKTRRKQK